LDIILIHIPIDEGKKSHDTAFSFSKTINFGLLSIGSYLKSKDYDIEILDFRGHSIEENINNIEKRIEIIKPKIIGLSCISGFSFPNLLKIANSLKKIYPNIPIIVGGKDHVGLFASELLKECKDIDIVVTGEGEEATNLILKNINEGESLHGIPNLYFREKNSVIRTNTDYQIELPYLSAFDYKLYPNLKTFAPSVEISRGCPFNCGFCVSARTKVRKKPISIVAREIESLCEYYNNRKLKIYFETPNMLFTKNEIDELIKFKRESNLDFSYRTETRVEYLRSHSLEDLVESGLKVIDLGLESGSAEMLRRMNKTKNPNIYLEAAEKILEKAFSLDILIKLNILFYIGESKKTIRETLLFIDRNKQYIRSISAYPLIAFHCPQFGDSFYKTLSEHGGSTVNTSDWKKRKMFPINSSAEFSYNKLKEISKLLVRGYQSETDFFCQKQYGYFSPQISYKDFRNTIQRFGKEEMPFFTSDEEKVSARDSLFKIIQ